MPKVLAIIQTPVFGGPHNQMLHLLKPLAVQGWDMTIVLPSENGTGAERFLAAGVPFVQTPLHRLRAKLNPLTHIELMASFLPEVRALEKLMCQYQPDVIHICGLMSLHGGMAAKHQDIPIVWQLLSNFAPPPLRQILTHYVAKNADVVMTTGKKIAEMHSEVLKLGDRVIPYILPVDIEKFQPNTQRRLEARAELGIPEDGILIGTVGNRNRQKSHERMIEAFADLRNKYPNLYFRILGANTPTYAREYQKLVVDRALSLGLMQEQQLQFVEPGSRVAELLLAFDIFALTSRAEGVPTAILEAMACGIPVVAMDAGAVEEVVIDGVTGVRVKSSDPKIYAQAVAKLLDDPSMRKRMAEESRRHAVAEFGVDQCVSLHCQAFEKAIRHHHRG